MDVPNKAIMRLRTAEAMPRDFRLHDVRRTVATRLAEMGMHVPIIEAILGHRAPKLVRTYQVHAPVAEMRAALERWSVELDRIITGLRLVRAVPSSDLTGSATHGAGLDLVSTTVIECSRLSCSARSRTRLSRRSMSASEYDPPRKRMIPGPAAFATATKRG
jgi:hypothetical protein